LAGSVYTYYYHHTCVCVCAVSRCNAHHSVSESCAVGVTEGSLRGDKLTHSAMHM